MRKVPGGLVTRFNEKNSRTPDYPGTIWSINPPFLENPEKKELLSGKREGIVQEIFSTLYPFFARRSLTRSL
jgi:hypothetical protein